MKNVEKKTGKHPLQNADQLILIFFPMRPLVYSKNLHRWELTILVFSRDGHYGKLVSLSQKTDEHNLIQ